MRKVHITLLALCMVAAVGCAPKDRTFTIGPAASIDVLHAPWDGLDDATRVRFFSDKDKFYFLFDVQDATVTLTEPFTSESDVEPEDRVELFFCPTPGMEEYWCAEIDPMGRVLDYRAHYYRDLDYSWNFSTLDLTTKITGDGYIVWGSIDKDELRGLGVDLEGGFGFGVFRADFRPDGSVNWYSAVATDDPSPDFHKPDMVFPAKIL